MIDLKNITFITDDKLSLLVMIYKAVREAKAQLVLCSLKEQIEMLFELTDMKQIFKIYPNREQFLQNL